MNQPDATDAQSKPRIEPGAPVFVVGCPRSGTTLLSAILDRHSQMAVTPETFFFHVLWHQLRGDRDRFPVQELVKLFTEARYTRDLHLDPAQLEEAMGTGEISVAEFFRIALQLFARMKGKSRFAEKTPQHLFYVPAILKHYPAARIICIVRDGRDCTLSLRKVSYAIPALRAYAARWRESTVAMLSYEQQFPEQFRTVRYESLLARPEEEVTSLMHFIGLEFEPGQLDPSRPTGVYVDWDFDIKKNILSEIDPSRAYAWKRTASPRDLRIMNSMMRPYLGRVGYEPGDDNRGMWPVRIFDAAMNAVFRVAFANRFAKWRRMSRYALRHFVGTSPHVMPLEPIQKGRQPATCNTLENCQKRDETPERAS